MRAEITPPRKRQREPGGEEQLVPVPRGRRRIRMLRHELVRDVQVDAPARADAAGEYDKEIEAAGDLPAPEIAGGGRPAAVGGEPPPRAGSRVRGRDHAVCRNARAPGREP